MTTFKFKALPLGSTFRFAAEAQLGYQGARGPWIKLTPRKYMREQGSEEIKVGSVNAEVVVVAAGKFTVPNA